MEPTIDWKAHENLFENQGDFLSVHSLEDFKAIPEKDRVWVNISDKLRPLQPIQDQGEEVVLLADFFSANFSQIKLVASEAAYGAETLENHKLRTGAAERLIRAEKGLQSINPALTFKITDSYRPIELQRQYFKKAWGKFSNRGLSEDELYIAVSNVVSDPDGCPPHSTGGTVDLTLFDLEKNQELPMGTVVDDIENELARSFHPRIQGEEQKNRLILYTVMEFAGFVNVPTEWWHYSYGDQEWALRKNQPVAFYDSII